METYVYVIFVTIDRYPIQLFQFGRISVIRPNPVPVGFHILRWIGYFQFPLCLRGYFQFPLCLSQFSSKLSERTTVWRDIRWRTLPLTEPEPEPEEDCIVIISKPSGWRHQRIGDSTLVIFKVTSNYPADHRSMTALFAFEALLPLT